MKVFKRIGIKLAEFWQFLKDAYKDCCTNVDKLTETLDAELKLAEVSSWGFVEEVDAVSFDEDTYINNLKVAEEMIERGFGQEETLRFVALSKPHL